MMNDRPPPPDEPDPIVPRDLKAKRTVPSPRKAATIRSAKGSIFGKASIPSVYWAGDDPTPMNNEEFTFYREDTPPLPDGTGGDKAARTRGYRQSVFDHDEEDSDRKRKRKCCGMTMWVFWLLVALIVAVVLGVGIGVGVGIGANQKSDQSAATTSSTSTPTPTTGASSTSTTMIVPTMSSSSMSRSGSDATATEIASTSIPTSVTSTSTSTPSPTATSSGNAICPDADNTVYNVIGSDKRFLRVCGVDYSGDDGAIDMSNTQASTMGDCMEICAKSAQCTGVSWGNVMINGAAELRCWLKRDLKKSHAAVENWNFAVLL
ncbi:hypothetical protein HER10_EVM0011041 [Colletotrichum scovillei]|uniref:PAN domain-containing protein n=1 Tax=Colletotrichum scovillei TaxID=1209932 RepID=A0A9P7UIF8_9PEZI|nr:uncharacterized protein HER10_EVM0011041 [Colletotrichum scovillei]KAF4777974.1 hypothetical protein HER10_EVM0011041 [Colletotrichum scovillei]KAG7059274.1 PAN domain-containing protein [Colletotrichum scovillei]KAG7077914.1 PAN domain-containing protein [Colletotrichum scovillei]KAG7084979.1 PAN domain-containing protein [Colletotrichum scovillei]